MKFNLEIPISLFLTFAAAAFGTSFQLGYFSDVGASFISLASFADWLFVCAAVFPFAGIAYVLVDYLRPWIEKHLEQGTFRNNIVYAIFVSIFPILLFLLLVAELFPAWADTAVRALRLYIILWLMFTAVPSLHSIVKKISNSEPVRPTLALYAILHLSVLQFFIGALYAKAPSTVCPFYLTGGASEAAEYLRYLGEGYLVRANNQVQLISKSEVRKVVCGGEDKKPTASTKRLKVHGLLV